MHPLIIAVCLACAALAVFALLGAEKYERAARKHERAAQQECIDKGGFPISKGPRTYDFHCFANDPLLKQP
jgi:hypothetical protein